MAGRWRERVMSVAGLCGVFLVRWLANQFLFPLYDTQFPFVRDVVVLASVLTLSGVALAAAWRPRWLTPSTLLVVTAACILLGAAGMMVGLLVGSPALVLAGALVLDVGGGLLCLEACLACLGEMTGKPALIVFVACLVAFVMRLPLQGMSSLAGAALYVVVSLCLFGLLLKRSLQALGQVWSAEAPAVVAVTRPASYLPFGHQTFVALFLFEVAYGYAITSSDLGAGASSTPVALAGLLVAAAATLAKAKVPRFDGLFVACVMAVLAGMLASPLSARWAPVVTGTAFTLGSLLFQALCFGYLISVAARNRPSGFVALAWGSAVMSLGVVVGANASKLVDSLGAGAGYVDAVSAVAVFVYAAVFFVLLRSLNMERSLAGIEDAQVHLVTPSSDPDADRTIEERCSQIAERRGLTAREAEILPLLARGRNSPYIQETLGISYNTARTHVRHIYQKCGYHTQQELIDDVESA